MANAETSRKGGKRGKKQQEAVLAASIAAVRQERNEGIRISEGVSNSHEAPTEDESNSERSEAQDGSNSELSNRKCRGKAKALDQSKVIVPIEVEFNERSQPIGKHAAGFATFLGCTARELVPLTILTWVGKALSDEFRIQIWKHITTYYIVDDSHKKVLFQRMAKLWRDNRSVTVTKVKKKAVSLGLQAAAAMSKPDNIHSMDAWLKFIRSRMTPAFLETCEKFKRMREQKTLVHRTSRKSFARVEHELKKVKTSPVTRGDVWLHAYGPSNKDSTDGSEDPELVRQVRQKMVEQGTSQSLSLKDDAISQVLGPDRRGRVRGYGFGAVPSKVDGQTHASKRINILETALLANSQELQELKVLVHNLLAKSNNGEKNNETSNAINKETSNAQHSAIELGQTKKEKATVQSKKRKENDCGVGGSEQEGRKQSKQKKHASIRSTSVGKECGTEVKMKKLHLLSWLDKEQKIVAAADLHSMDPTEKVHCVPLGLGCWKVWVCEVYHDIPLFRPNQEFDMLVAAKGSTVAWPINCIKLLS